MAVVFGQEYLRRDMYMENDRFRGFAHYFRYLCTRRSLCVRYSAIHPSLSMPALLIPKDHAVQGYLYILQIAAMQEISGIVTSSPLEDLEKFAALYNDTSQPLFDF